MGFSKEDMEILSKLVGPITGTMASHMDRNLECFLHPEISLFIPSCGQCEYAISPSHTHPSYTFIYYFQSVSDFLVEEKHLSYDLGEGKCLSAMSPGIPHQEIEEDHFQSYIAIAVEEKLFQETALQYLPSVPIFQGEAVVPHPELLNLLRCFMLEVSEKRPQSAEPLRGLASAIVHLIVRSVSSETHVNVPLYDRFEVNKTIAYMNSHFSEKILTEELAQRVNLSAGHFARVFKSVTGATPNDFLNILRLQKACSMLRSNAGNITEIALACGYSSASYFSTCFFDRYQTTPTTYRREIGKLNAGF